MNTYDDFFDFVRGHLFGGNMTPEQVLGTQVTLNEWNNRKLTDLRWLADMLATQKWETAHTMQPVRETLARSDAEARRRLSGVWYAAPDPVTGLSYYGRGLVQLTHRRNYEAMGKLLGINLVEDPDRALEPKIATAIMFEGMTRGESHVGDFTGVALEDFFNDSKSDWVGARKVINGTDHDADIADIALGFYAGLTSKKALPDPVPHILMYGAYGKDVDELQTALVNHGFDVGPIDGDFGEMTRRTVMAFQEREGLTVDGIVGPETRKHLNI